MWISGDHLGEVERVELPLLRLVIRHHLHVHRPRRKVAVLDGVVQVTLSVIRISSLKTSCVLRKQVLNALIRLEIK